MHPGPLRSVLFALVASGAVALGEVKTTGPEARGLALIHEGKLLLGAEALRANVAANPRSRTALFYAGIGSWWRHISEFGNDRAAAEAIDYLQRSIQAERVPDGDTRAMFEAGTAWMLLSHLEGARGSILKAALHARKGKSLLDEAKRRDPGNRDIGFALGAYDYYADRLPRIMKGIRALLFLPGGNASRGIAALEIAAREGRLFSCEATLVLADIYASPMEDKYDMALEILDRLVERHPQNPFFRVARSEVASDVGEHELALADVREAWAAVPHDDVTLRAGVALQEARVRDRSFETAAAVAILEPVVASTKGKVPAAQHARMRFRLAEMHERLGDLGKARALYQALDREDLEDRLEKKVGKKLGDGLTPGEPSYREAQTAITLLRRGQAPEAEAALTALLNSRPKDPILLFFRAESQLAQGKGSEASSTYEQAYLQAGSRHLWVKGWCMVRRGDIEAASARRDTALRYYQQAFGLSRFTGRGVVSYRLARIASLSAAPERAPKEQPSASLHGAAPATPAP